MESFARHCPYDCKLEILLLICVSQLHFVNELQKQGTSHTHFYSYL